MSVDNCFKNRGFRAGSWVPLPPVKRVMLGPLRVSASAPATRFLTQVSDPAHSLKCIVRGRAWFVHSQPKSFIFSVSDGCGLNVLYKFPQ